MLWFHIIYQPPGCWPQLIYLPNPKCTCLCQVNGVSFGPWLPGDLSWYKTGDVWSCWAQPEHDHLLQTDLRPVCFCHIIRKEERKKASVTLYLCSKEKLFHLHWDKLFFNSAVRCGQNPHRTIWIISYLDNDITIYLIQDIFCECVVTTLW